MTESTKRILEAALLADQTVTEDEKMAFQRLVSGKGDQKKMIKTADACRILGCTRQTLRTYELQGKVKAVRLSTRRLRYDQTEVESLLQGGAVK